MTVAERQAGPHALLEELLCAGDLTLTDQWRRQEDLYPRRHPPIADRVRQLERGDDV
jgi:hypothetical protein